MISSVIVIVVVAVTGRVLYYIYIIAVTGVDGHCMTSDDLLERPLQVRYDQKMAKYGQAAERNDLRFIPAVFSHTGQIHEAFKVFVKEQIRLKFEAFEGDVKGEILHELVGKVHISGYC